MALKKKNLHEGKVLIYKENTKECLKSRDSTDKCDK